MKAIDYHAQMAPRHVCEDDRCKFRNSRGALTVEAAIVLPLILCAFFSVVFLIKTVYTYEIIQHALTETASEISSAGYIYHISGVRDLHDTVRNSVNDRADMLMEQADSIFDAYNSLKGIGSGENNESYGSGRRTGDDQDDLTGSTGMSESIKESIGDINDIRDKFNNVFDHTKNILSDPLDELKTIACYIAAGAFDDAKTQLFTPIVKLYMKKYLVTDSIPDADKRLAVLDIVDGFDGLDFSESSFLADTEETIDIVVKYRVRLPVPVKFTKDLEFVQRAKVKVWMGGNESNGVLDDAAVSKADDIWSLSNFQRGLKIRRKFGANLPDNFPVIARFENGKAVMIKSMDLTAESYQKPENVEKTLKSYINELIKYDGQNKPWGRDGIIIKSEDIIHKELLLVIPENKLQENIEIILVDIVRYAESGGVKLTIKKYGVKIQDDFDNAADAEDAEYAAYKNGVDEKNRNE